MTYEQILVERRGAVSLVTLDRPERRNAWTPRMSAELLHAIAAANDDPAVGAIVLTGAGKGFCAGADVRDAFQRNLDDPAPGEAERGTGRAESVAADPSARPATAAWVDAVRGAKPVVAAVNGVAVGVGLTMILPCDVILAGDEARFGMFFVKMGLVPELASTHFLVQRAGFGFANEMCLTGRLVGAEEAVRRGVADRLVPQDRLLDDALALGEEIAANPDRPLRLTKDLLGRNGSDGDLDAVQRRELAALAECYATPEHREAVRAFVEKRRPRFRP